MHDGTEMHARVRGALEEIQPTVRCMRELAEAKERCLAQRVPLSESHFQARSHQSTLVDSAGIR